MFSGSSSRRLKERHRHNSWHNLVQLEDDRLRFHRRRGGVDPAAAAATAAQTDIDDDDGAVDSIE